MFIGTVNNALERVYIKLFKIDRVAIIESHIKVSKKILMEHTIQQSHCWIYIKGNEISVSKRCVHFHVYYIIIHDSQDIEST